MRSRQPSLREEWRDVRGWVPWLVAGVYFPLYVVLDFVAGGSLARMVWLPRSVSVALCSLAVALLVAGAVIARRLGSVSPSTLLEEADPRRHASSRGRSTVGSGGGGVNRKTVETDVHDASAGGAGGRSASQKSRQSTREEGTGRTGSSDGTGVTDATVATDATEATEGTRGTGDSEITGAAEEEEWPDEWISGDEV